MQLLTPEQVLKLHQHVIEQSGGAMGIRNQEGLESALAQPRMSYADQELYPTLIEKVAALGFSLINNYPDMEGDNHMPSFWYLLTKVSEFVFTRIAVTRP